MFNISAEMLHQENGLNIENVLTKEKKKLSKTLHLESVLEVVRLNICRSCLRTLLRENLFWPNVNISRERLSLVWHQGPWWSRGGARFTKLLLTTIGGKYMLMDQRNTEKHEIIWFCVSSILHWVASIFKKSPWSWQTVSSLGLTCLEQYGLGSTFLHRHKS